MKETQEQLEQRVAVDLARCIREFAPGAAIVAKRADRTYRRIPVHDANQYPHRAQNRDAS